jgi:hypothetical protein
MRVHNNYKVLAGRGDNIGIYRAWMLSSGVAG